MKKEDIKIKILFVCLGNICRSPAGEGIMKKMVKKEALSDKVEIDSAGTSGYHAGTPADSRMKKHALARGYTLDSLSRRFKYEDFERFDIILAMDDNNYRDLTEIARTLEDKNKIKRITDYSSKMHYDHVPDPYYEGSDGFELVMDILEDACSGLLKDVKHRLLL